MVFFPVATCLLKGVRLLTFLFFIFSIYFLTFFPSAMYKKIKLSVILRGGYAYSRGYVYCFCQIFQGLCLFKGVHLYRSREYLELPWAKTPPLAEFSFSLSSIFFLPTTKVFFLLKLWHWRDLDRSFQSKIKVLTSLLGEM